MSMKRVGWVFVLMLLLAKLSWAQMDAASLRVLVEDQSQAVIAGAEVRLTNTETNVELTRVTNDAGYAAFTPLVRGLYTVAVTMPGFSAVKVNSVVLDVNERKLVRVELHVTGSTETVEVTAGAAAIQTEEASVGQVIKGNVAVELPLAARRYTELALLVPGVTNSTMTVVTRGPGWFVANGNYHTQNNFVLDGFDNNQGTQNAQSLSAQVVQPSPDSISEFKVQTNSYSAEFGRSAGAVVNVSIKSGTNDVHGSGWYYNRDAALAANSWRSNLINAKKDDLRWHQFGGTLGGPIIKDKVFYFGSYEGFHRLFSDAFLVNVPTEAQRSGIFAFDVIDPNTNTAFVNRTIPLNRFDPLGKKLIDLYPMPNLPRRTAAGGRIIENYGVQRSGRENTHKFDARNDYYLSSRDRLFARYSFLQQDIYRDPIFEGLGDGVGDQGQQYNRNQSLGVSWTRTISARSVLETRFGYNRTNSSFSHATANEQNGEEFGFKGFTKEMLTTGGLPLISVSNYNSLGTRNFRPQYQKPITYQVLDTLSIIRGQHATKFGFEVRAKANRLADISRRNPAYTFAGQFTGDAIADLLLGYTQSVSVSTAPEVNLKQQAWSGFVQDDWKVRSNLTINAGLRYEYTTPYYGADVNKNINFNFNTRQLVFATDDDKYLIDPDRNNFAPRVGLSYQIHPDRLVLRSGFGLFYSGEDMRGSEGVLAYNPPQLIAATLTRANNGPPPVRLSDPLPAGILSNYNPATVALKSRDRDQNSATVFQWNTALQFLLPWDSTLELAYVGNQGRNLLAIYSANQVPFGMDGSVAANRPYPEWQQIGHAVTKAESSYNALQMKFEKRMSRGFYALTSYTFASALDEYGAWGASTGTQIGDNFRLERGPQSQSPRQRLTYSQVLQLPFGHGRAFGSGLSPVADAILGGWQISGIATVRSGLPVNVTLAGNGIDPHTGLSYTFLNRNGGELRPDRVGDPNSNSDARTDRSHYLNARSEERRVGKECRSRGC